MASTISTARDLPSIRSPALMPRMSSSQLSKPAASSVPLTFCAMLSLTRARLTTHSRKTAPCTCSKSSSSGSALPSAGGFFGRISPTSWLSRWSSTWISMAATCTSVAWSALSRPATTASRRAPASCTRARSSPRPSTPRVSPSLRNSSICGLSSSACPPPRRTKISSTSLTRARSSRIAAATVCMSLTEGAERFSRSCSMDSSTGSNSLRRKEARTAATRGPAVVERAT